jgi:hypothetical protein
MPTEIRKILFSTEELLHAVQSYARMVPRFLPAGRVVGFEPVLGEETGLGLTVQVEAGSGNVLTLVMVHAPQARLVEVLVRCCLENNIPIPRRGTKMAKLVEDRLALVIHYDCELMAEG